MAIENRLQRRSGVAAILAVPRSIVALGFVSLFMDISSEIIHSLLPVFLVAVLGASALSVGFIEGIAEATSQVTKLFAGAFSDWIGKRKPLILAGYGLADLTKPLFPLASGVGVVMVARFLDRIGKGVRGAPRDALIGDVTPVELRGTAFGLRQVMDTVGAFIGPLIAMLLMAASSDNFRLVFWVAVLSAIIAVLLILYGVQEPNVARGAERLPFPMQQSGARPEQDASRLTVEGSLDHSLGAYDAAAFEPSAVIGSAAEELMVCRLFAGASRIRTIGPTHFGNRAKLR